MSEQNTMTTLSPSLSATMQTYYDRKLLKDMKPKLVHYELGQKRPLPKNQGKTVNFRKWTPFPPLTEPLAEGEVPNGQDLTMTSVQATIDAYGGYVRVTDMLDMTALDPVINDSVELMADQGALTIDHLTRDVIAQTTNVQYAGGVVGRGQIAQDNVLTTTEIRKAVRALKKARAPMFERGGKAYYVAIVSPDTTYDLQNDTLWQDVSKYQMSEQILSGEIGRLFGVIFVESTEALDYRSPSLSAESRTLTVSKIEPSLKKISISETVDFEHLGDIEGRKVRIAGKIYSVSAMFTSAFLVEEEIDSQMQVGDLIAPVGEGLNGCEVAATLVLGRNAFGVVELDGGNVHTIIKPAGSGGAYDPLDQVSTSAWKVNGYAATILQPTWIVRIEHAISD
ncbi:MAG: N4-gp56 family major capsid protein [Christensenellales bacterium]|jgi:N4-gp56 family major capsid protein